MTDKTEQLSLNDVTDYGLCFACGPRNPYGLKLHMERDGNRVVSKFTALQEYQGFPGYLPGQSHLDKYKIISSKMWSFFSEGVTSWTIHP